MNDSLNFFDSVDQSFLFVLELPGQESARTTTETLKRLDFLGVILFYVLLLLHLSYEVADALANELHGKPHRARLLDPSDHSKRKQHLLSVSREEDDLQELCKLGRFDRTGY